MSISEQRTILVAHEDPIICMGLVAALREHDDFKVVAAAERLAPGLETLAREEGAQVVITDYERGIECLKGGSARARACEAFRKVVIVTSREREVEIRAALQLGIRGYVLLGTDLREFVEGMRAVARGAHFLSRSATHRIASSLSYSALTPRESDVLQLLVEGHGNKQIAAGLGIATETAKCHVKAILEKLGASTRTQAASIAMSRGLVHSGASHAFPPIALAGVEKRFAA
jgi:DNA-binding NarL/FixJ family response regulator